MHQKREDDGSTREVAKDYLTGLRVSSKKAMPPLFKTGKSVFTDLVELVQLTQSPEAAKAGVSKYLKRLGNPCPTPGCLQKLNHEPFLCKGYRYRWYLLRLVGDEMKSLTAHGYALSTPEICDVLQASDSVDKEPCRECRTDPRLYREAVDGLFCHGCGFFIDYKNQQVGYSPEWTASENLKLPQEMLGLKHCAVCSQPAACAKFADYYFCSHRCLEEWLSNPSRKRSKNTW